MPRTPIRDKPSRKPRARRAFTIIELVIAVTLYGLVILFVGQIFSNTGEAVSTGLSRASKKPQWTVSGAACSRSGMGQRVRLRLARPILHRAAPSFPVRYRRRPASGRGRHSQAIGAGSCRSRESGGASARSSSP